MNVTWEGFNGFFFSTTVEAIVFMSDVSPRGNL